MVDCQNGIKSIKFVISFNYARTQKIDVPVEAYDLEVGLLLNFGAKSLEFKRVTNKKFKQKNQGNPLIK